MAKLKLLDKIDEYNNTVMKKIIEIPGIERDSLRQITYTTEQVEQSKKEKEDFLKRFSEFIPKAEKILNENKEEIQKKYEEWKKTDTPPKTTLKAKLLLVGAIISSVVASLLPVIAVILETYGFVGATWISAASIPEIFGGSALLNRYDVAKANINKDYENWKEKGDQLLSQINSIDKMIDTMYVLKFRIEFYVNDDNIMVNEWTFQSVMKEAELLMEAILNI
ncbi:MAG: hypothetical protein ACTSRP_04230 [Candidatus Helarchaeota archaeon]